MSKSKIIRLWGRADNFDIEFTENEGGIWTCIVPPDTVDGQYACEIWAINEIGKYAYWTGILYMCNSVCHLEIHDSGYNITFFEVLKEIEFCPMQYEITLRKGCLHYV